MEARLVDARASQAAAVTAVGSAEPRAVAKAASSAPVSPTVPVASNDAKDESSADDAGEPVAANGVEHSDTNVWPTEAEEAAFLADAQQRGEKVVPATREAVEEIEDDKKALPKLDELVNRIPPETRDLLDELFRARFVAVRRVKKKDLKS